LHFEAWSIQDVYAGCGKFDRYAIAGSSTSLGKLQYPEPGYHLDTNCRNHVDRCLRVRVTSVWSLYNGTFSLQLYPQYGQDPVSIEYRFDLTNCRASQTSFSVSSHPPQVVVDREEAPEVISENFYSAYFNRFITSRPNCPLLKLEILDNSLAEWTDPSITLTNQNSPSQAVFGILNNVAFTKTFKIRGYTTA
jgi:hypothetical protein